MLKYLFLLLAGLITLNTQAQRTLTGIITDTDNHQPLPSVSVLIKGTSMGTITNANGEFHLKAPAGNLTLVISFIGYQTKEVLVTGNQSKISASLAPDNKQLSEVVVTGYGIRKDMRSMGCSYSTVNSEELETYAPIHDNRFLAVNLHPLSTFAADVDRAAYSNVRRFLNDGELPPADAVRVEEMINYFDYQYKPPTGNDPVAIYTDMTECPWEPTHQLVRIGLKAMEVSNEKLPPANLVFLIDVSGSMSAENKLPLVIKSLKVLTRQLRPIDHVAIVVYAGAAGVVLPSTPGSEKMAIMDALDKLEAGGSTAGGAGIQLAYNTAAANYLEDGNNRVIIATDGDFNVGVSSESDLEKLVSAKKEKGIFLSVLGFGMGNLKDNKLEILADKGNGNYAYIDTYEEARRTLVTEFGGTLFTIAKDVKLQVEFNPHFIESYRLIGYENRMLAAEDFKDDKKDAGEMGAGHTVTALYEVVPSKDDDATYPLKYYQMNPSNAYYNEEALTVNVRYKKPKSNSSKVFTQTMRWNSQKVTRIPDDFKMATAVAAFGMLLRNSEFKGKATYEQVLTLAESAKGADKEGYRAEFIQLVKKAQLLNNGTPAYSNVMADDDNQ
ncbi:von Willebrand factor type A domain-containing protein [Chitinophaga sancti]|uniref:vWA domain-containing protein n=1 Tax=Chitinophaga sancti TaxID=1004 RepID=UPI002A748B29|nr:von Willebrand factor type A domain-containing protein [Chitinophaga sancti]WPQ64668.1 von Willebrand factor type A domain-containing protein [Chitinophaga sancti]